MINFTRWNKKIGGMCLLLAVSCAPSFAQTDLGAFTGSPYDTWDGLTQAGIQVRTFEQPLLLAEGEPALRRYLQYVPRNIYRGMHKNKKYPLVVALPGADLSAEVFREWDLGDRLERLADKEKFVLVYANAYGPSTLTDANPENPFFANGGYWRTCFGRPGAGPEFFTVDDSAYLRQVIANVRKEGLPIDTDRIYLMGMSNGGEMAQRAAREMPEILAGVGIVMPVFSMPATVELSTCVQQEQKPLSMMFIYSPKDTLLDWIFTDNGFNYGQLMTDSLVAWRDALDIHVSSEKIRQLPNRKVEGEGYTGNVPWALASINSTIKRYDYARAPSGADFAVLEINSAAGHAWPNYGATPFDVAEEPYNGFKNQDIQAEKTLWRFLKKSRRIPARHQ